MVTAIHRKSSDFWAVTAYFNPIGYKRRLENYRRFRRELKVPLVTVELFYGERSELEPGDILFQEDDWSESASRLLDRFPLIQLFKHGHDLLPNAQTNRLRSEDVLVSGPSLAYTLREGLATPNRRPRKSN